MFDNITHLSMNGINLVLLYADQQKEQLTVFIMDNR